MKRLLISFIICFSIFLVSFTASSLELMSNESLDKISGRAISINQPDITELFFQSDPFYSEEPELSSFSQGNTELNSTVIIDFLGFNTTDEFEHLFHHRFYSDFSAQNIKYRSLYDSSATYENGDIRTTFARDIYSFVIFDGAAIGKTFIPEYYDNNPALTSKTLKISQSKIDLPQGLTGNYMCSYQGNLYYPDDIPNVDQSFLIYPNRQTISTGTAKNGDLTLLLPKGEGDNTVWRPVVKNTDPQTGIPEYLVIPEGEKYIHISLSLSETQMDMKFKISLSNIERSNYSENTKLNLQTLGTVSMTGGATTIHGGNVIITTNTL